MPRKLPRHVECWRDRHKKIRVYFRRGKGARIALPDIASPDFDARYLAALAGDVAPVGPKKREPDKRGTLGALITSYKQSAGYIGLRDTSKAGYNSRLEALRIKHGHRTVSGLTRERIIAIMHPYADRPGASHDVLKKMQILIRHAIDLGWLKHDPSLGIKRPKIDRIRSWTEGEIATFRTRWPLGSKQRTAFELFLNTGQRRSDIHRMTWSHITADKTITVIQQKTGRKLVIPLHRDLVDALARAERNHVPILTTAYNRPFTVDGFGQWMRDAITEAGLSLECQPHGLRKATGRRLAEAGASARQIMSVLGHTTLSEAEKYTADADQIGLAIDAMSKLEGHKQNGSAQTAIRGLGKRMKTKGETI